MKVLVILLVSAFLCVIGDRIDHHLSKPHEWQEVGRTFYSPIDREFKARGLTTYEFNALLYGKTIIELRCKLHGEVKIKEFIGVLE